MKPSSSAHARSLFSSVSAVPPAAPAALAWPLRPYFTTTLNVTALEPLQ